MQVVSTARASASQDREGRSLKTAQAGASAGSPIYLADKRGDAINQFDRQHARGPPLPRDTARDTAPRDLEDSSR
jgi:hypothetical protein